MEQGLTPLPSEFRPNGPIFGSMGWAQDPKTGEWVKVVRIVHAPKPKPRKPDQPPKPKPIATIVRARKPRRRD